MMTKATAIIGQGARMTAGALSFSVRATVAVAGIGAIAMLIATRIADGRAVAAAIQAIPPEGVGSLAWGATMLLGAVAILAFGFALFLAGLQTPTEAPDRIEEE